MQHESYEFKTRASTVERRLTCRHHPSSRSDHAPSLHWLPSPVEGAEHFDPATADVRECGLEAHALTAVGLWSTGWGKRGGTAERLVSLALAGSRSQRRAGRLINLKNPLHGMVNP
jgi:hypothetical protein